MPSWVIYGYTKNLVYPHCLGEVVVITIVRKTVLQLLILANAL